MRHMQIATAPTAAVRHPFRTPNKMRSIGQKM
jgi:hypothetical protein